MLRTESNWRLGSEAVGLVFLSSSEGLYNAEVRPKMGQRPS